MLVYPIWQRPWWLRIAEAFRLCGTTSKCLVVVGGTRAVVSLGWDAGSSTTSIAFVTSVVSVALNRSYLDIRLEMYRKAPSLSIKKGNGCSFLPPDTDADGSEGTAAALTRAALISLHCLSASCSSINSAIDVIRLSTGGK